MRKKSGSLIKSVCEFEKSFANIVEAPYARAFARGRNALYTILKALRLGPGATVGVCGYTCWSVVEAVYRLGAKIRFYDTDQWLCIDPVAIRSTPRGVLNALIVQHTFGFTGQFGLILDEAQRLGIPVIEDCCHTVGSHWNGKHVGSFGVAAIYSFQWGKPCVIGQGGMLTINDVALMNQADDIIEQERLVISTSDDLSIAIENIVYSLLYSARSEKYLRYIYKWLTGMNVINGSFENSIPIQLQDNLSVGSFAIRMGKHQAKIGSESISSCMKMIEMRRTNFSSIKNYLNANNIYHPFDKDNCVDVVPLRCPFRVNNKEHILFAARQKSLDIAGWYDSIVHPISGKDLISLGYDRNQCPHSERAINQIIHIPTGVTFSHEILDFILVNKDNIIGEDSFD